MAIFWINNNGIPSFFDSNVNSEIPQNAQEISSENWQQLILDQSAGKILKCDSTGPYSEDRQTQTLSIEEYRAKCKASIISSMLTFIEQKPDKSPRYTQILQSSILSFMIEFGLNTEPANAAKAWIYAVQQAYLDADVEISEASTIEQLDDICGRYDTEHLESMFGVQGTVYPDPDVTLSMLWTAAVGLRQF